MSRDAVFSLEIFLSLPVQRPANVIVIQQDMQRPAATCYYLSFCCPNIDGTKPLTDHTTPL
jgi:hypothetical protein